MRPCWLLSCGFSAAKLGGFENYVAVKSEKQALVSALDPKAPTPHRDAIVNMFYVREHKV